MILFSIIRHQKKVVVLLVQLLGPTILVANVEVVLGSLVATAEDVVAKCRKTHSTIAVVWTLTWKKKKNSIGLSDLFGYYQQRGLNDGR